MIKNLFKYGLSVIVLCCFMLPNVFGQDIKLAAILNKDVPDKDMSFKKLKSVIKGEKTKWSSKKSIKLAIMSPKTALGEATAESIFNYSASGMNKHYLSFTFQGKMQSPKFFKDEKELIEYVRATEGAIGIISYTSAKNSIKMSLSGVDGF